MREVSSEIEEYPYKNIIKIENNEFVGINIEETFPYIEMDFEITEEFLRDRIRLWMYYDFYNGDENEEFATHYGIFFLPNNIELSFSDDEFSTDFKVYTKEQILEYKKVIPTFELYCEDNYIVPPSRIEPSIIIYNFVLRLISNNMGSRELYITKTLSEYYSEKGIYYIPIFKSSYENFNTFNYNGNTFIISPTMENIDYYNIAFNEETDEIDAIYTDTYNVITYDSNFFNCNNNGIGDNYILHTPDLCGPVLQNILTESLSFIKTYQYYAPIKQYILYSQDRFYTLGDVNQYPLVNNKTLLKVVEAFETIGEEDEFSFTMTPYELFSLFNVKLTGTYHICEPKGDGYNLTRFEQTHVFKVEWIDRKKVKLSLDTSSGSGGSSSGDSSSGSWNDSSDYLYIGEFEE